MVLNEKLLDDLAKSTGFAVDQLSFIIGMLVTLCLAVLYNMLLSPRKVGRTTRLTVGLVWGIVIGWLCYTSQIIQLLILLMLCYVIIHTVSPQVVHRYILTLAMTWLSANHIYRQVTDYGGYKLDITGPLMLITIRLTYVGFALHDGLGRDPKELTNEERRHSIKKRPNLLEFSSYVLHFSMLLVGPTCTYFEFMEFIDGTNMKEYKGSDRIPVMTVSRKIVSAFIFLGGVLLDNRLISVRTCIDPKFMSQRSLFTKIIFGYFVIAVTKMRYYYAWTFADGVINSAGMGFNGYDKNGEALWDKFTSAKIKNIELATNSRSLLENWNIGTEKWLRRIIYNRSNDKLSGVFATSVTSAFWHGFYPGYYLCFVTVGFATLSSRRARRSFRSYFQESKNKKIFYDILTWLVTYSIIVYACIPFILLRLEFGLIFWRSMYFYGHILILLGFASPWISAALGMERGEKSNNVNAAQGITGSVVNNSAPKKQE